MSKFAKRITSNLQREIDLKNIYFQFSPGNLLITYYQLIKFEAPRCDGFEVSSLSKFAKAGVWK